MAAIFQLVPTIPMAGYNAGWGSAYPSLAMNRLGLNPLANPLAPILNTELLAQALMGQLVGMLSQLMSGQLSNGSSNGATSNASPSGDFNSDSNAVDASQFAGGTSAGRTLAAAAQNEANAENTHGWCYRGVSRALHSIGVNCTGGSAYMAADQLARNPKVREIKVNRADLPKLPPGAIVVWDKGPGHPHGHISVALGNGREASDHVQSQIQNMGGDSFRVFMPI